MKNKLSDGQNNRMIAFADIHILLRFVENASSGAIIVECDNLAKCKFFSFIGTTSQGQSAAQGFVARYCKGDYANSCVRRRISKALGGPQNVPDNMLPNGFPLAGTTNNQWSQAVKALAAEITAPS